MFLIGSCRYQFFFPNHFPPRLHSTKEILYFLNNYNNISLSDKNINYIFGDIIHSSVINASKRFIKSYKDIFKQITSFAIEISTRKYILENGIPLNSFYYKKRDKDIIMDENELEQDIIKIKEKCIVEFGIKQLYVLPHINLKFDNGNFIPERAELQNILENICQRNNIKFLNINKAFNNKDTFEKIMPDALHFSHEGRNKVSEWLYNNLNLDKQKLDIDL